MFWSDRVAGTRRPRAAQEVSDHGGADLPDQARMAVGLTTSGPAAPRVETRPEGWRLVDRRGLLKAAGMAAFAAPASGLLAACGGGGGGGGARAVRIGVVSPRTGALRKHSDVDSHVIKTMRKIFADGIQVGGGGSRLPVEILVRDGQSDRNRAAAAATDLIFTDKVDVVLAGATSDNVNPVADVCEAEGVPCLTTGVPWEAWFYSRGGRAQAPFSWTYHVNWGMNDLRSAYLAMWQMIDVPRTVVLLAPGDQEGAAFANRDYGLPLLERDGYQVYGADQEHRYRVGSGSFGELARFISTEGISIVAGSPSITDLSAFWKALNEIPYRPRIVSLSKGLLFTEDVDGLGVAANGFTTEVGWSPIFPFRSYLTNQTSQEIANEYTGSWSQPLGFTYALFEILAQALTKVDSIDDPRAIADAIAGVQARTILGNIAFGDQAKQLPKNVATVPLAGGRWTRESNVPVLRVVNKNGLNVNPEIEMADLRDMPAG